jgi:hypothetical protein
MEPVVRVQGGVAYTSEKKWRPIVTISIKGFEPASRFGGLFDTEEEAMREYTERIQPEVKTLTKELQDIMNAKDVDEEPES